MKSPKVMKVFYSCDLLLKPSLDFSLRKQKLNSLPHLSSIFSKFTVPGLDIGRPCFFHRQVSEFPLRGDSPDNQLRPDVWLPKTVSKIVLFQKYSVMPPAFIVSESNAFLVLNLLFGKAFSGDASFCYSWIQDSTKNTCSHNSQITRRNYQIGKSYGQWLLAVKNPHSYLPMRWLNWTLPSKSVTELSWIWKKNIGIHDIACICRSDGS